MTETFGLIATSETPLVICNVMRSGPSTGMPTKQEQGDLNGMLYGGHGEVPGSCSHRRRSRSASGRPSRRSTSPRSTSSPYLTADLSMAVTEQTFTPDTFDMDEVEIDRGFVVDETTIDDHMSESGGFQPHEITDDGISPRAFPGTADGAHMSTGLEHDEQGRRTEDTGMRVEQVDKRNRKVDTAEEREDWSPREFGDADADTLVIRGVERGSARRGGRSPRRRGGSTCGCFPCRTSSRARTFPRTSRRRRTSSSWSATSGVSSRTSSNTTSWLASIG